MKIVKGRETAEESRRSLLTQFAAHIEIDTFVAVIFESQQILSFLFCRLSIQKANKII